MYTPKLILLLIVMVLFNEVVPFIFRAFKAIINKVYQSLSKVITMENVIENNKLIAEFMGFGNVPPSSMSGWEPLYTWPFEYKIVYSSLGMIADGTAYSARTLRFNLSWDWLMPVVEKIPKLNPDNGKLYFEFEISRCHCRIWSNREWAVMKNAGTTLEATYAAVIEFIKWYNTNSK